jgi:hypothetical protein
MQAMEELGDTQGLDEAMRDRLLHAFAGTADWMRNR